MFGLFAPVCLPPYQGINMDIWKGMNALSESLSIANKQ